MQQLGLFNNNLSHNCLIRVVIAQSQNVGLTETHLCWYNNKVLPPTKGIQIVHSHPYKPHDQESCMILNVLYIDSLFKALLTFALKL